MDAMNAFDREIGMGELFKSTTDLLHSEGVAIVPRMTSLGRFGYVCWVAGGEVDFGTAEECAASTGVQVGEVFNVTHMQTRSFRVAGRSLSGECVVEEIPRPPIALAPLTTNSC